jgi:hypothetical protein
MLFYSCECVTTPRVLSTHTGENIVVTIQSKLPFSLSPEAEKLSWFRKVGYMVVFWPSKVYSQGMHGCCEIKAAGFFRSQCQSFSFLIFIGSMSL